MKTAGPSLSLLGGIALEGVPPEPADFLLAQSKVIALLAYLALSAPGAYQRRDRIVALLWPELDQAHARTALRKAIYLARGVLGEGCIVNRGDEELALTPGAIWCDVVALHEAIGRGLFGRAVELFRGELLPGFHLAGCHDFDAWLSDRRVEVEEEAVAACMALAKHLEAQENRTEAANLARKAARIAWTNERVLRRSLVMLDRLGDRAGALRLYEEFAQRLRSQLEAEPSPETVSLAESLRAGRTLSQ